LRDGGSGNVYFMDGNQLIALRLSDGLPLQTRDEKDRSGHGIRLSSRM